MMIAILVLLPACSAKPANVNKTHGTLKISIVVLKTDAATGYSTEIPDLEVAACAIPVTLPDGPREVTAMQNGMQVEAGWDEARSIVLQPGQSRVEFRNFHYHILNPIIFNQGGTAKQGDIRQEKQVVGPEFQPVVSATSIYTEGKPEKEVYWTNGLTWIPIRQWGAQEIDLFGAYMKKHPELAKTGAKK